MNSMDDAIRRAAGHSVDGPAAPLRIPGLQGVQRTPPEPEPVAIDAIIRWRAGKAPQPTWRARNGVPLTLE